MDPVSAPFFAGATAQQLASVFSAHGLKSPKELTGHKAGKTAKQAAKANDADPISWPDGVDGQAVVSCLTDTPLAQFTSFASSVKEHHLVYPANEQDTFVVLSHDGQLATLAYGFDGSQVTATVSAMLGAENCALPTAPGLNVGADAATALFAMLDHLRTLFVASLLERTSLDGVMVRLEDLAEQIKSSTAPTDYRWLCPLWSEFLEAKLKSTKTTLRSGCEELADKGLLSIVAEGKDALYQPSDLLVGMALDLILPLPALILNSEANGYRSLLVAARSCWLLARDGDAFTFANIDGLQAGSIITNATMAGLEQAVWKSGGDDQSAAADNLSKPDEATDNGSSATAMYCSQCGAKLRANANFCTSCGAPV